MHFYILPRNALFEINQNMSTKNILKTILFIVFSLATFNAYGAENISLETYAKIVSYVNANIENL